MKMKVILPAFFLLASFTVRAITPSIAYQGVLRGEQRGAIGTPTQTIEFRLYRDPAGGEALWGCSRAVQLDTNGLFSTELSDSNSSRLDGATYNSLAEALKAARTSQALYIGLTVAGSSGEISPRQKILTVPFANYAQDIDTAKGNFTVQGETVANSNAVVKGDLTIKGPAVFNEEAWFKKTIHADADLVVKDTGQFVGYGIVPIGTIVMWAGKKIPDGWALCDGNNGTPDLRDRFIVSIGQKYKLGDKGGEDTVTLTKEQMPKHKHTMSFKTVGYTACWNGKKEAVAAPSQERNNGADTFTGCDCEGGDQPHENRPPYYALSYIMRVR